MVGMEVEVKEEWNVDECRCRYNSGMLANYFRNTESALRRLRTMGSMIQGFDEVTSPPSDTQHNVTKQYHKQRRFWQKKHRV